jgi:superfamily I DNA/RNA helicase
VAVIVPGATRLYVQALNAASEHYGLDLTFADSRTRLPLEDDKGFRFAYAVLRLASNREDQLAWRTILHLVPRQPSDRISNLYNSGDTPLTMALRARAPLDQSLAALVDRVVGVYESVGSAESRDQVMSAIDDAARDLRVVPVAPWEDVLAVLEEPMAAEEESIPDDTTPEHARELLTAGRRAVNRVAADLEPAENQVFVYTIFQAKGQEWDHVYLAGAHRRGFRDQNNRIGEGTRLLYVALTRAGKSLTISKFNSTAHRAALIAATRTASPAFPAVLVEAAAAAGVPIEGLGPQP